jgi:hypothetical protein
VQKSAVFLSLIGEMPEGRHHWWNDEQIRHERFEQSARVGSEQRLLWAGAVDCSAAGLLVHHRELEPAAVSDRQHDGGLALTGRAAATEVS